MPRMRRIRHGTWPAVITVNGFLSEGTEGTAEWEEAVDSLYPKHEWFHLDWEAKCMADLLEYVTGYSGKMYAFAPTTLLLLAKAARVLLRPNPWYAALANADRTGVMLADGIRRLPNKRFILCGHSLGARVIYAALRTLATTPAKPIDHVQLLGGAVDNSAGMWAHALRPVCRGLFNYYSLNDNVLKYMYKIGTSSPRPIGRHRVYLLGVENSDVSADVDGHMEYKTGFGRYGKLPA